MADKMKKPNSNTRKAIAELIAGGELNEDAKDLLQWAAQYDTLMYLEKLYELPIIRYSIFIQENRAVGIFALIVFVILFELWHLPEFRIPILTKLAEAWLK